jgi:hypothetical protein
MAPEAASKKCASAALSAPDRICAGSGRKLTATDAWLRPSTSVVHSDGSEMIAG